MDNINFADIDFSTTNRSRIKSCSKCNSAQHTITKCPMNHCVYCKLPGHIASSCSLKKQESQARKRIRNMSPEQIQRQRENDLADNMSPEEVEQHNARNRRESMNPIQIQRQRENDLAENMSAEQVEQQRVRHLVENMNPIQIQRQQENHLADNMSPEQVEQHNARNRRENMNPIQIQRQRENDLADNMSPEQVEQQNARHRRENMNSFQIQRQQENHLTDNMSAQQVEQQRVRHLAQNLTPLQLEQQRERHRVYTLTSIQLHQKRERNIRQSKFFKKVEQEWYDERPCEHCFYVALKSQRNWTAKSPSPCCQNGLYVDHNSGFPQLSLLPPGLKELCLTRGEHFGKLSAKYNKILCIGSTGVENSHNGGFEQIAGDHAVKMNGRSYHFLSKDIAKVKGGINFFTFDGVDNANAHLMELNGPESARNRHEKLENMFLKKIFDELKEINEFVQELSMIGNHLHRKEEAAQRGIIGALIAAEETLD
jgi:hypothetical protein